MSRLGVKTRVFHLGDYRRASMGEGQDVPEDYFFVNGRTRKLELIQGFVKLFQISSR